MRTPDDVSTEDSTRALVASETILNGTQVSSGEIGGNSVFSVATTDFA